MKKQKKTFLGNDTCNARITISYRGVKPNVSFSYPNKKQQFHGTMFSFIIVTWMGAILIAIKLIELILGITIILEHPENLWLYMSRLAILLLLPPVLIYYPFKKYWSNLYPKFQAAMHGKKRKTFTVKDIQEKDGQYFCEVLVFRNILLNYRATKDFSRQLECMEIHEHDFQYFVRKRRKKGRDHSINEWMWYARFYFNNKPRDGKLEVIFV